MAISEPKSAHLREVLLFAFNWKKSATEAHRMLEEVYSDHALSKSQCYRWFKKFQSGDFELDNEPYGKPPQKFEDAELQALLDEDNTQMQEKLAKQLQVSPVFVVVSKEEPQMSRCISITAFDMSSILRKRRKFYAFFIDLKKAFDTVPQALLWKKLLDIGLNFRFINLIKNYYENMTAAAEWAATIYYVGYGLSLVALSLALAIFFHFKTAPDFPR
ncbi:hypothetical protein LAZ67_17000803 [Cordylochernes scorpioides]|uniref:Mos1 transposase HTH domain-containing protein n=1 Tax=Cordylochernes scorpioides TaxID=51811 RepID=A0ABY6LGL6_9ARAC|nr:hypothetical protein LAZ67_17000803 [Cordylochernes scorpioides]